MPRSPRSQRQAARQSRWSPVARANGQRDEPLPPGCEGPTMRPYDGHNPKIEFEERLGEFDGPDSGTAEGYVFKVRINSQPYALKMFKFYDAAEERNQFLKPKNDQITDEDFIGNLDPFYAECRAYGRIKEFYENKIPEDYQKIIREFSDEIPRRRRKGIIAAECYGYLYLSAQDEEYLRKNHHVMEWNRQDDDQGKPIRALVKQLIETEDPIDRGKRPNIRRMRDDLWTLHGIGVYPRDVVSRNYRGGLLVDFGGSWTVPHCAMRVLARRKVVREIDYDLTSFDKMIDQQGIKTSIRAVREKKNSRTRSEKLQVFWQLDESGKNARPVDNQ